MSNFVSRRVAALLAAEGVIFEEDVKPSSGKFSVQHALEAYEKLGGLLPGEIGRLPVPDYHLVLGTAMVVCSDELCFNRYAAQCYRSVFYETLPGFNAGAYLRFCRQFEAACKKGGVQSGVWTHPLAEHHFGRPSDPGDFFGVGSPGWKLSALCNFLRDLTAADEGYSIVHLSVYDQLMIEGKLLALGDLLRSPANAQLKAAVKYLRRRLGLPAPSAE